MSNIEVEEWWKPIRLVRICLHNLPKRTLGMLIECPCGYQMTINSTTGACTWQCETCSRMLSNPIHRAWHFGNRCFYRSGLTDDDSDDEERQAIFEHEAYSESSDDERPVPQVCPDARRRRPAPPPETDDSPTSS